MVIFISALYFNVNICLVICYVSIVTRCRGLMVSALNYRVRGLGSSPGWDIVLCSWARHFTLTVPLFTQVHRWVLANCWGKSNILLGSDLRWTSIPSRGSRNTSSRFMLQKPG